MALLRRLAIQPHGLDYVFRNAPPGIVHQAKIALAIRVTLFSSLAVPLHSLYRIFRNAFAVSVRAAETVLRSRISAFGLPSQFRNALLRRKRAANCRG